MQKVSKCFLTATLGNENRYGRNRKTYVHAKVHPGYICYIIKND